MENLYETKNKEDKPSQKKFTVYSFIILVISISFLVFACTKYYTEPSDGIADQLAGLFVNMTWLALGLALIWRTIPRGKKSVVISCFIFIIALIAIGRSVMLLHDVSSVKNAALKMSSIINDIKDGKEIAGEKKDESQYGEMAGLVEFLNNWMHDIQSDGEKMYKELNDCNYLAIFDQQMLLQSVLVSQSSCDFEGVRLVLSKYEKINISRFDEFETRVKLSTLPGNIKERLLSGFNVTKVQNLKSSLNTLQLMKDYTSETWNFLIFMREQQPNWKYENGKFQFQTSENTDIFNSYAKNFQRIAKEIESSREQIGEEFEEKQKELEQLVR